MCYNIIILFDILYTLPYLTLPTWVSQNRTEILHRARCMKTDRTKQISVPNSLGTKARHILYRKDLQHGGCK